MQFKCQSCGQVLSANENMAGRIINCPACGSQMQIPVFQAPTPPMSPQQYVQMASLQSYPPQQYGQQMVQQPYAPQMSIHQPYGQVPAQPYGQQQSYGQPQPNGFCVANLHDVQRVSMSAATAFNCITLVCCIIWVFVAREIASLGDAGKVQQYFQSYMVHFVVLGSVFFISAICSIIFTSRLHYRCWKAIPDGFARMTPGKAVGFLFIPLFNLYWLFPSIGGLGSDCARFAQSRGFVQYSNLKALGITLAILMCVLGFLGGILFVWLILAISIFIIWVLFYRGVIKCLTETYSQQNTWR